MKKILLSSAALLSSLMMSVTSCNVMDLDPTGWYGANVTYSSMQNMDMYVMGLYKVLYANSEIDNDYVMDDGVSELIKYSWWGDKGQVNKAFYDPNNISPLGNYRSNWSSMYEHIRKLNEYFTDIHNGEAAALDQDQVKIRTAEVRFLRAFAYQELVLRHGGVILRIDETKLDGPEDRAKERSSEKDCWDFIIQEYGKAFNDLPLNWDASNYGRLTKGAALGMKARACLYAKRWEDAVTAVNELLKLNQYDLVKGDYMQIFTNAANKEIILPVLYKQNSGTNDGKQHYFNNYFCAPGDDAVLGYPNAGVGVTATPTEEYASMFDISVNGQYEAFSWDNLAKYNNEPYKNREPRFYASILYNGASWLGRTLDLTKDSGNYMPFATGGQDNVHKTTTGYVIRKFLSDNKKINFSSILSDQYWIEMRLAEIYLIRSEAYARLNKFAEAYEDLKTIRDRVGLPELAVKSDWDSYLKDLSKERVCELGLEGHRSFDLTRWGIAQDVLDGKRLHGIEITKSGSTLSYKVVECDTQDRLFPERMNIFPIPYTEIKNNSKCLQNPEWL